MYSSASSIALPFYMFINAGINFPTSIFLNWDVLSIFNVSYGVFFINTDAYLSMISFLVGSSTISANFCNAFK